MEQLLKALQDQTSDIEPILEAMLKKQIESGENVQAAIDAIILKLHEQNMQPAVDALIKLQNDILLQLQNNQKTPINVNYTPPEITVPEIVLPAFPEIPTPQVTVQPPEVNVHVEKPDPVKVNVEAPIVNIDLEKTNQTLEDIKQEIKKPKENWFESFKNLFAVFTGKRSITVRLVTKDEKNFWDAEDVSAGRAFSGSYPTDNTPVIQAITNLGITNAGIAAALANYKASDIDETTSNNYFGFLKDDGGWYILKMDTAANTLRYFKGTANYTTSWTGRAALAYDYYHNIF